LLGYEQKIGNLTQALEIAEKEKALLRDHLDAMRVNGDTI